jgi:iron complex outermembrane receptor protein
MDTTGGQTKIRSQQTTEEIRISSPKEDRFNWIAGFMYFNWDLDSTATATNFSPTAARQSYKQDIFHQNNTSLAGFANARYKIFKGLSLSGGVRYTYDHKDVKAVRNGETGASVDFTNPLAWWDSGNLAKAPNQLRMNGHKGWSQVTGEVTPEYKITEDFLVYFKFAKGFRAGQFNPAILAAQGNRPARLPLANPEVLYDWELGAKTEWLDGRLVFNATGFYYLLQNAQLNVQQPNPMGIPGANTSSVQNAAGGKIQGLEFDLEAAPWDALRLRGNLGLLKAWYTDFTTFQGADTVNASGNKFYRTPSVSASLGADYRIPIGETQAISAGTDWTIRCKIYHNAVVQNDPIQQTPSYAVGNVELRYSFGRERFTLQGYIRNVADTSYKVLSTVVSGGAYPTYYGPPRTYGLQLIARL